MSAAQRRKTILVVEDEPNCRAAVAASLEFGGYEVSSVENGNVAMEHLEAHGVPDLILLDLMLPEMDGWEFLVRLSKTRKWVNAKVALLSAERELDAAAARHRLVGVIRKPVELATLLERVGTFLRD